MNEVLASRYAETIHRLAVGIEPRDAVRGGRVASALELRLEAPTGLRDIQALRHPTSRWTIRYVKHLPDTVDVVLDDPARRYVPRRLRFPVVPEADVLAAEQGGGHVAASRRTWRPALFPGAAYPLGPAAAAIRGRAHRAGAPAPWTRVTATVTGTNRVVGRAHGDDRGEFLLLVGPDPAAPAELPALMHLTLTVRSAKPALADPALPPLETVAPPGPDDDVSAGLELPPGYQPGFSDTRDVDLVPGRVLAGVAPFDLA